MGFADSIRANVKKRELQIEQAVEKRAQKLFKAIVSLSPTDPGAPYSKGEFINNWIVGFNSISNAQRGSYNYDGIESLNDIAKIRGSKVFFRRDGKVTLTNNTPYGFRVEYKGWPQPEWSGRQGPYAPIAKAFIRVVPKFKRP
jgi:hypothetical protein